MRPPVLVVVALCPGLGGCDAGPTAPPSAKPTIASQADAATSPRPAPARSAAAVAANRYEPSAEDIARLTAMLSPDYADFIETFGRDSWLPAFRAANVDLDGDGMDEVLLLLEGNYNCGSGGCTFRVYRREGGDFQKVSGSTVTRLPIGLLESTSRGWRDLTVGIGGGGLSTGPSRAILRYDGGRYPLNPTTSPAERSDKTGVLVLTEASPLHPLVD